MKILLAVAVVLVPILVVFVPTWIANVYLPANRKGQRVLDYWLTEPPIPVYRPDVFNTLPPPVLAAPDYWPPGSTWGQNLLGHRKIVEQVQDEMEKRYGWERIAEVSGDVGWFLDVEVPEPHAH